jgi:uncharacterized repeat protein (TIGR01451 family)
MNTKLVKLGLWIFGGVFAVSAIFMVHTMPASQTMVSATGDGVCQPVSATIHFSNIKNYLVVWGSSAQETTNGARSQLQPVVYLSNGTTVHDGQTIQLTDSNCNPINDPVFDNTQNEFKMRRANGAIEVSLYQHMRANIDYAIAEGTITISGGEFTGFSQLSHPYGLEESICPTGEKFYTGNLATNPHGDNVRACGGGYNDKVLQQPSNTAAKPFAPFQGGTTGVSFSLGATGEEDTFTLTYQPQQNSQIQCRTNSDCGTNGLTGNSFCQGSNVYQNFITYTCNNPGTVNSFCSNANQAQLQQTCNQGCNNGSCTNNNNNLSVTCSASPSQPNVNQTVTFNAQPSGGSNYTYSWSGACNGSSQNCSKSFNQTGNYTAIVTVTSNGQSAQATCQTAVQAQNITCSQNSDCGTNGYVDGMFCQNNNVFQNYKTYTCNNPGTVNSYCSNSTQSQLQQTCNQGCSNGSCTNNNNNLSASCSASPNNPNVNQQVNFYANASGGTGSYTYSWSGACSGSSQNCYSTYSQNGTYSAIVNITSGSQTQQATCSVNVNGQNQQNASFNVVKTVRNLTAGSTNWASSTNAAPGDVLQFNIAIQATGNQSVNITNVKDTLPTNLIYRDMLTIDGVTTAGNIISGINLGNVNAGQTRNIQYQVQVASAQNFSFGNTTLTSTVTATDSSGNQNTAQVSVIVTRSGTLGATSVSTGLTNNPFVDSFFFPLVLGTVGWWFAKTGKVPVPKWVALHILRNKNVMAEEKLQDKIAQIKQRES